LNKKQILLAEDDPMLASLLQYRFEKEGYDVVYKNNGKDVKKSLTESFPDIIISDIMIPHFSGIELVDYTRNHLKSNVPIILMSAASNEENVLSAFELGANDFVAKPINISELLMRISKEINKAA